MRSALIAVLALGCTRSSPSEPAKTAPTSAVAPPVVIDAPAPVAPPPVDDAAPPIDPSKLEATCGMGWRSVSSTLTHLVADDRGATLCSSSWWPDHKTHDVRHSPIRCARVERATGTFTEHPGFTTTAAAPAVTLEGLKACKGTACVTLDVPAPDAEALLERDAPALDATGSRALVVLAAEKTVGVFDTATGKRLQTLQATAPNAACPAAAFFIGDLIYASARRCDDLDIDQRKAWIFAGAKRTAIKPLMFGDLTPTQLAGDLWAVASLKPYRVDFIHGATGAVTWSVPLPGNEYDPMGSKCCLALGVTAFGTVNHEISPIARIGTSSEVAVVTPFGITWIDPVAKTTKVVRFPPCK